MIRINDAIYNSNENVVNVNLYIYDNEIHRETISINNVKLLTKLYNDNNNYVYTYHERVDINNICNTTFSSAYALSHIKNIDDDVAYVDKYFILFKRNNYIYTFFKDEYHFARVEAIYNIHNNNIKLTNVNLYDVFDNFERDIEIINNIVRYIFDNLSHISYNVNDKFIARYNEYLIYVHIKDRSDVESVVTFDVYRYETKSDNYFERVKLIYNQSYVIDNIAKLHILIKKIDRKLDSIYNYARYNCEYLDCVYRYCVRCRKCLLKDFIVYEYLNIARIYSVILSKNSLHNITFNVTKFM